MCSFTLKPQEIPLDDPLSCQEFDLTTKPFVATPAAIDMYGEATIIRCLSKLRLKSEQFDGLDYLQVFTSPSRAEPLWFIEDGSGGAITALLPSDY